MSDLSPDEIAAIKAENSRQHRAAQTTRNLIWALIASLIVVLALVLVIPRPDPAPPEPIDYVEVAGQAQPTIEQTLATPVLPPGWQANRAQLAPRDRVPTWYIGFITPEEQFIALNQGIDANETWVSNLLRSAKPTGAVTLAGIEWTVYDQRKVDDAGNIAYALVTTAGESTYVLHGTASDEEFALLAQSIGLN